MPLSTVKVHVHLLPEDLEAALRADVTRGLTSTPKELPPKWFYDDRGCAIYDKITKLPEYYPFRAEHEILRTCTSEIARITRADTLVELGSGTSQKTRALLDALATEGTLRRFVPFDVAEPTLRAAAEAIAAEYPGVEIEAVVGDFERHVAHLPRDGHKLVAFLGSTIGNLVPSARETLLRELASTATDGDWLLLGTDLVKNPRRLVAAYDDAAGVTAEFNKNVLARLNRDLGADFDLERFEHVARYDADNEWIEMRLRSSTAQPVHVEALDLDVHFEAGEELRTEISAKFRPSGVRRELAAAGFELVRWWNDPAADFALSLSTYRGPR